MEFIANHMHLIMVNYRINYFFRTLSKNVVIGICIRFLNNFEESSIKDSDVYLFNMTIINLC